MIVPSRSSSAARRRRRSFTRVHDGAREIGQLVREDGAEVEDAVARRARDRRRPGLPARRRLAHRSASPASATAAPGSSASGNAPAPTLPIVSTTSHAMPSAISDALQRAGARAQLVGRRAEQGERGDLRERARGLAIERERRLERGERELVHAIRARERIPSHRVDPLRVADDEPRLRSAEQLVAAHHDDRRAGRSRLPRGRLARQVRWPRARRAARCRDRAGSGCRRVRRPARARRRSLRR